MHVPFVSLKFFSSCKLSMSTSRNRSRRRVWRPKCAGDDKSVTTATDWSPTIHDQSDGPRGQNNETRTCYAFAAATAVRSAQMRIFGRAVERHEKLVKEIADRFGTDGADLNEVLAWLCPLKNLQYDEITPDDAEWLLQGQETLSRVVLAGFSGKLEEI